MATDAPTEGKGSKETSAGNKVVIRHLPPLLKEEVFHDMLLKLCREHLQWFNYVPGKVSSKGQKPSLAFVKLSRADFVPLLKLALESRPFVDEQGVSYRCQVELAPFQKVPKQGRKKDPREGTHEQDPYFIAFQERLALEEASAGDAPAITAQTTLAEEEGDGAPVVTALMQHIMDKHSGDKHGKGGREKHARTPAASTPAVVTALHADMLSSAAAALNAISGSQAQPAAMKDPPPRASGPHSAERVRPQNSARHAGASRSVAGSAPNVAAQPAQAPGASSVDGSAAPRVRPRVNVSGRMFGGVALDALSKAGLEVSKAGRAGVSNGRVEPAVAAAHALLEASADQTRGQLAPGIAPASAVVVKPASEHDGALARADANDSGTPGHASEAAPRTSGRGRGRGRAKGRS